VWALHIGLTPAMRHCVATVHVGSSVQIVDLPYKYLSDEVCELHVFVSVGMGIEPMSTAHSFIGDALRI
jgi:hypothetical protein